MSNDVCKRLEEFTHGHKIRDVSIGIDNGYGASCWRVDLSTEFGKVHAAEVSFLVPGHPDGEYDGIPFWKQEEGKTTHYQVIAKGDAEDLTWELEPVIDVALRFFTALEAWKHPAEDDPAEGA